MKIEGRILEVMESMPLQLIVESDLTRIFVHLRLETTITRESSPVDPGLLQPGHYVRIEGSASIREAMTADSIEILD